MQVSITFDPFLYLPVPLPQKQKVLTVYFFAKEPHKKPIKVGGASPVPEAVAVPIQISDWAKLGLSRHPDSQRHVHRPRLPGKAWPRGTG